MAGGIEVAQAYVTIIPSMKGSQKTIADELDADKIGSDAGKEMGDGIGSSLSAKSVVIGNIITDALRSVASKALDMGRDIAGGVYEGYAANEQLVGGMQKLFGDSADIVIANANNAFMSAGKSANDYMEGVTSIAASLVNSVGGDTAEAARLANVAMVAMSDNVNTFGTDAQSVQNAIQGLAKGNYSMLDNLSLGFAGTQQGMVDLINASGVLDHQLTSTSELADVGFGTMVEAIQAVQENMGIAGTTANEAMGTLEGSANAASSAWQNVLSSIGSGDASQIQASVDGLIDAVFGTIDQKTGEREGGLAENLTGLAQRAFDALGAALPGMLDSALSALPPDVGGPLKEAFDSIGRTVEAVAPVVTTAIGAVVTAVGTIAPVVAPLLPLIAGVLGAVKIVGVITGIVGAVTGFITTAGAAIGMISSVPGLIAVVTTALGGPITIIAAIVGAIVAFLATNEDARAKVVEVWNAIKEGISNAVSGAVSFVTGAWDGLKNSVTSTMTAISATITRIWTGIKTAALEVVKGMVSGIVNGISSLRARVSAVFTAVKTAITTPINAARDAVSSAVSRISSIVRGVNLRLPHISLPHFSVSGGKAPWGIGGKGSMPSFSVSWYAKGGYFDQPTLFAGVGERGGEFVWPSYAPYLDRYADALASKMGGSGDVNVYLTYNGSGDADELVSTLTRELRMMRMTGAI
jgi:phage-related protein